MKLAVSNLAWDLKDSDEVFKVLKSNDIKNIEFTFTKLGNWNRISYRDVMEFKKRLDDNGIVAESAQSIFYNTGIDHVGDDALKHFEKLIEYADILDTKVLVFGSSTMRKKVDNWEKKLISTFQSLDSMLKGTTIDVVIEPNSKHYGGDYFFRINEIIQFIEQNKLTYIKTMIDTHNSILEGCDPRTELIFWFDLIKHIHVSENSLKPINSIQSMEFHKTFSNTIRSTGYNKIVTYEVLKHPIVMDTIPVFSDLYKP
jgi:sugar phosphate isomerase/epimerase